MESLRQFDISLTRLIQRWPNSFKPFISGLSMLGEPILVLAVGFSGYVSAIQRGHVQAQRAFLLGAIAYGLNTALKQLLHRRRPHNLNITNFGIKSYSFPSGHAFGTVIFYGLFSYLSIKYLSHPLNVLVAVGIWSLIFLIGVSRVYLKAHYPTDVVGGWILGLISLYIIVMLAF
ncbi:phosphatase PAP2 family protein [Candidatus Saccharibacteria bacterium]|nr:phosphatase PAP2 family protein [Candidatus Saccharibacteria bacterium]